MLLILTLNPTVDGTLFKFQNEVQILLSTKLHLKKTRIHDKKKEKGMNEQNQIQLNYLQVTQAGKFNYFTTFDDFNIIARFFLLKLKAIKMI